MKTKGFPPRRERAYALLLVMIFTALSMIVLVSAMNWSANTAQLTERNNQFNAATLAAEAATEKVVTRILSDYKASGEATVYGNLSTYRGLVPNTTDNAAFADFEYSNAQGTWGQMYVDRTQTAQFVPLDSK